MRYLVQLRVRSRFYTINAQRYSTAGWFLSSCLNPEGDPDRQPVCLVASLRVGKSGVTEHLETYRGPQCVCLVASS